MSTSTAPMTADQLLNLPDDGMRHELVLGQLRTMPLAGWEHGALAMSLSWRLGQFVAERQLGTVVGADTGFVLSRDPDTVRAPDSAFVRLERTKSMGRPKAFFPAAPDLAVEVTSPGDTLEQVDEKVQMWLAGGCREVWVANPRWRSVTIYRSNVDIRVLTEHQPLESPDLLPGFRCQVGEIFSVL